MKTLKDWLVRQPMAMILAGICLLLPLAMLVVWAIRHGINMFGS